MILNTAWFDVWHFIENLYNIMKVRYLGSLLSLHGGGWVVSMAAQIYWITENAKDVLTKLEDAGQVETMH